MPDYHIFVPSYDRPEDIEVHDFLHGVDYTILLDDDEQYKKYAKNPELDNDRLYVTGYQGLTPQKNVAFEMADEGDWVILMDDDIGGAEIVEEPYYSENDRLDVKSGDWKEWKRIFRAEADIDRLFEVFDGMVERANELGIHHMGFTDIRNHYFRAMKWSTVHPGWGFCTITKVRDDMRWDVMMDCLEDADMGAQHMLRDGGTLVNRWVHFDHDEPQEGGQEPREKRLKRHMPRALLLDQKFPGLFEFKPWEEGWPPTEPKTKFKTPSDMTKSPKVDQWKGSMVMQGKCTEDMLVPHLTYKDLKQAADRNEEYEVEPWDPDPVKYQKWEDMKG